MASTTTQASASPATAASQQSKAHDSDILPAVVFTTAGCPYCKRAKSVLQEHGVDYREVDVGKDNSAREAVAKESGRKTVPVIYLGGVLVGGADDLDKIVADNKLQSLLSSSPKPLPDSLRPFLRGPQSGPQKQSSPEASKQDETELAHLKALAVRMGKEVPTTQVSLGWLSKRRGVFSGADAVKLLRENCKTDTSGAVALGRQLQMSQLLHHVTFSEPFTDSPTEYFALHRSEPPLSSALNAGTVWLKAARAANVICEDLRERVLELYEEALSPDGKSVKYSELGNSKAFRSFADATQELQRVDLFALSRAEKMAFFINIYNALVIHAFVEQGLPKSSFSRLFFYSGAKYHIGGHDYSLDEIENGVLRANRPPASSLTKKRPFGPKDPRRFHTVPPLDPRIHFALNCGAKSCPPVKIYTPENLEGALQGAASAFCEDEVQVDERTGKVTLSKIFDWYKGDFGSSQEERLRWLLPYLSEEKGGALRRVLSEGRAQVEFSKYDWGVNE